MCGRFALGLAIDDLPAKFNQAVLNPGNENELTKNSDTSYSTKTSAGPDGEEHDVAISIVSLGFDGSFNIPPTSKAVIIYKNKSDDGSYEYVLEPSSFGLVPNFEKPKDPAAVKRGDKNGPKYSKEIQSGQSKRFNCRKETIGENKSLWTEPRKNSRCVVPISGYFEWQKTKKEKPVYYVTSKDRPLLFLAAVYAHNTNYKDTEIVADGDDYLSSFSIVTGPAEGEGSNDLSWLHERKPILLEPNSKEWFDWLNPNGKWDPKLLETSLNHKTNKAYDVIESYEVDKSIGNASTNGPDSVKPLKKKQKGIDSFVGSDKNGKKTKKEDDGAKKNGKKPKKEENGDAEENGKDEKDGDAEENGKDEKDEKEVKEEEGEGNETKEEDVELIEGADSGAEEALEVLAEDDKELPEDGVKDLDEIEDDEVYEEDIEDVGIEGEEDAEEDIQQDEKDDEEVPSVNEEVEDLKEDEKDENAEPGNIEIEEDEEEVEVDGDALEAEDVKVDEEELKEEAKKGPKSGAKRAKSSGGRPKRGKR